MILSLALAGCASRQVIEMSLAPQAPQVDDGFDPAEPQAPARQTAPVRRAAKGPALPRSATAGASAGAAGPEAVFTPEWYAKDKAEAERLKNLTNICRC